MTADDLKKNVDYILHLFSQGGTIVPVSTAEGTGCWKKFSMTESVLDPLN